MIDVRRPRPARRRCSPTAATRSSTRCIAARPSGRAPAAAPALPPAALPDDLAAYLDEVERDILVRALERHRFNRTAAGASLGLSLRQMRYRMARLGVNVGGDGDGATASDAD